MVFEQKDHGEPRRCRGRVEAIEWASWVLDSDWDGANGPLEEAVVVVQTYKPAKKEDPSLLYPKT